MWPHKAYDVAPAEVASLIEFDCERRLQSTAPMPRLKAPNPKLARQDGALLQFANPAQVKVDVHSLNGVLVHDMNGVGKSYFDNGWRQ